MPGPFGGALRGLMPGGGKGAMLSMISSGDWTYVVGIAVLLVIVIVLAVLTIREFYLLKKKKK